MPIPENERKIARVNAAARACDMSYGTYVALTGGLEVPPPELLRRAIPDGRRCAFCGQLFQPRSGRQKYCSPYCRKAAYDERQAAEDRRLAP
jgi:hypothetical protein